MRVLSPVAFATISLILAAPAAAQTESGTTSASKGETGVGALTLSEGYRVGDPPPPNRLFIRNLTGARVNPLGLLNLTTLSYRSRIAKTTSAIAKDNFIGIGVMSEISPAFARIGPVLEIQPLTILRLWAAVQVAGYYSSFDLFQSFPNPNAEYSDTEIKRLGDLPDDDPQANYSTGGTQATFGANLQMKIGPLAARNFTRLVRADYSLRDGDTVFYDQFYDVLVPDEGFYINNDTDLLFVTDWGFVAGARWTLTHAFYQDKHFQGAVDLDLNPTMNRIGPLLAYTFNKAPAGTAFNNPTVLVLSQWWVQHRYRTGQDVSAALPYIAVAFLFTGDLWVSGRSDD